MRTSPILRSSQSGFTLFELMLTLAVAAVILGLAIPNMRQFILNNRMTSAANDLLIAVHTARTEAIKRQSPSVMCFTADSAAAQPVCNGNGTQGWIVFIDDLDPTVVAGTDNNGQVDANEEVLVRHGPAGTGITFTSLPAGNAGYVAFNAAGFGREVAALGSDVASVALCDYRGNVQLGGPLYSAARAFKVSATGRPSVTRSVADVTGIGGCP
jgi:type IV fimbrial biogenesis protein FimT